MTCPNCGFQRIPLDRKAKEAMFLLHQQSYRYKPLKDALELSKDWCGVCKKDLVFPIAEELLKKAEWSKELIIDW